MNFDDIYFFLDKNTSVSLLENEHSKLVVSSSLQGRIMTSCVTELQKSYGWINFDLIENKTVLEHIHPFGGEDRLWFGPEGGQYSIFFKNRSTFEYENWQTPSAIDSESFKIAEQSSNSIQLFKSIQLKNYQDFEFNIEVNRIINLFDLERIKTNLNIDFKEELKVVGFESRNELKNVGKDWSFKTGVLSIWSLGMFQANDFTTSIIPVNQSNAIVNTNYFNPLSKDKLNQKGNAVLFNSDGNFRSKIGLKADVVKDVIGSFDTKNNVLTIVKYDLHPNQKYVNSLWEQQENPYDGDVVNAYNDGELNGEQLGKFYELETSSPAVELKKDEILTHNHQTYHFEGNFIALNKISEKLLGFNLNQLKD